MKTAAKAKVLQSASGEIPLFDLDLRKLKRRVGSGVVKSCNAKDFGLLGMDSKKFRTLRFRLDLVDG